MCDDFYEGAYLPKNNNKILMCSNTLMNQSDFDNALQRQLILMYDNVRGGGRHDLNNCKHLACSEVRAALFNDQCKVKQSTVEMLRGSHEGEKLDAQKYCFRNIAVNHLKEKQRCADKSEQYIDYVFE